MKKICMLGLLCVVLYGCQKEEVVSNQTTTQTTKQPKSASVSDEPGEEEKNIFTQIKNQLYRETDIKLQSVSYQEDKRFKSLFEAHGKNLNYDVYSKISLRSDKANDVFTVYTVNDKDETGRYFVMIVSENTDDIIGIDASFTFTENTLQFNEATSNALVGGWKPCFTKCMGRVLDSSGSSGATISILGGLGGLGCSACGVAAGIFLGVGTLGCAGGCA